MKALPVWFLFVVSISSVSDGLAAQKAKEVVVTREYSVIGDRSCKDWIKARTRPNSGDIGGVMDEVGASSWLMGYLSGVNRAAHSSGDLLSGIDYDVATDWADTYCQKNPNKKLNDAAEAMLSKLKLEP